MKNNAPIFRLIFIFSIMLISCQPDRKKNLGTYHGLWSELTAKFNSIGQKFIEVGQIMGFPIAAAQTRKSNLKQWILF